MACWSSKGVSAWPAGRPSPACLNTGNTVAGELVAPHAGLHRRRKQAADLLRGDRRLRHSAHGCGAAATICDSVSMLKFARTPRRSSGLPDSRDCAGLAGQTARKRIIPPASGISIFIALNTPSERLPALIIAPLLVIVNARTGQIRTL